MMDLPFRTFGLSLARRLVYGFNFSKICAVWNQIRRTCCFCKPKTNLSGINTDYKSWQLSSFVLTTKKASYSGTGKITITKDSRVILVASFNQSFLLPGKGFSVKGTTADGFHLEVTSPVVIRHSYGAKTEVEFKAIRFRLFDPNLVGQKNDEHVFTLKNLSAAGFGSFSIGGVNCKLEMLPDVKMSEIVAGDLTAKLAISDPLVSGHDLAPMAWDICQLLTLSQRSPIFFGIQEEQRGGKVSIIHLNDLSQDYKSASPLTGIHVADICTFIQGVWVEFKRNDSTYNLHILIEYYWRSHQEGYAELKLAFCSFFMEALKFNWAKNIATNLNPDLKANGLIRGFKYKVGMVPPGVNANRPVPFEDLLVMAANYVGIPAIMSVQGTVTTPFIPGTFTFIDDRNAIFHSGQAAAAQLGHTGVWPFLSPILYKVYDQMDEFILKILKFKGTLNDSKGQPRIFT